MGMFDTVLPECVLPDEGAAHVDRWQTKDFEPACMEKYRISPEGRLFHEVVHYEDRSDPNAEGLLSLRGMMTPIHEGWQDLDYHGVLNFYGEASSGEWFEYDATFTHGNLESIKRRPAPEGGTPQ